MYLPDAGGIYTTTTAALALGIANAGDFIIPQLRNDGSQLWAYPLPSSTQIVSLARWSTAV